MISWLNIGNTNITNARNITISNDYNDLTNKPTSTLTGTIQEPIKLWKLETGIYILNGYVQHSNELMSEAKGLFATVTAGLVDNNYVISVYIPFWEGLYEYILPNSSSDAYSQHQVVDIVSQYDVLTLDNEMEYTPTQDYHPSTKKYANDMLSILRDELANVGINKDDINALKQANRRRDIIIQALLSQNSDKMVTINEDVHDISLDLAIDNGIATINSLEGSTLVNVSKQKEDVSLTNGVGVIENSNNVDLINDAMIRPIVQGNTLVNNNAQWDDTVVIGNQIEPLSGIEIDVEETFGELDVACEGNTLVNIHPSAIPKYEVYNSTNTVEIIRNINYIKITGSGLVVDSYRYIRMGHLNVSMFKPNTTYTVCFTKLKGINQIHLVDGDASGKIAEGIIVKNGRLVYSTITLSEITSSNQILYLMVDRNATELDIEVENPMIFEGDLTTNPPTEYIEGLKGSFENEDNNVEVEIRYCPIEFGKGGRIE